MLDEAGALQQLLAHDRAITPEEVADAVREALNHDRFLVLPHPQVAGYYAQRARDPDRWLGGMADPAAARGRGAVAMKTGRFQRLVAT